MSRLFKNIHPELPIFSIKYKNGYILYTPHYLAMISSQEQSQIENFWKTKLRFKIENSTKKTADWICQKAVESITQWKDYTSKAFFPECLTVYFNCECQLNCRYCYSKNSFIEKISKSYQMIDESFVIEATKIVINNCKTINKRFTFVAHGVGEPTFNWKLFQRITLITKKLAHENNVEWWGYLATNGILNNEQIKWIGANFDLIGISSDGFPEIQNFNRPFSNGNSSEEYVKNTCLELLSLNKPYDIRTTITKHSYLRMKDIIEYLINEYKAKTIRIEPVFLTNNPDIGFSLNECEDFFKHFIKAETYANKKGVRIIIPDVRLDEIHGSFCDDLKQNLRISSEGKILNCFVRFKHTLGKYEDFIGTIILDKERIKSNLLNSANIPIICRKCLNIYHCSRNCPERCHLEDPYDTKNLEKSFKCELMKMISVFNIKKSADLIYQNLNDNTNKFVTEKNDFIGLIGNSQLIQDKKRLEKDFLVIKDIYDISSHKMPEPIWAEKGLKLSAEEVEHLIPNAIQSGHTNPLSIYLHFPFCNRKCLFCDCFSDIVKKNDQKIFSFTDHIKAEIKYWSKFHSLTKRKVTTIHFGGGTPNYLPQNLFEEIIILLKSEFSIDNETEFAIESTSSLLSKTHLHWLKEQGFSRLHIGVQTLDNNIRKLLGRKENSINVIEKTIESMNFNFITSIDLIYGLPFQTLDAFLNDIKIFIDMGIFGISLYSLNETSKNVRFIDKYRSNIKGGINNYVLFSAGDQLLTNSGYKKTHFAHYSLPPDKNLYYRHSLREEDLLSMGPSANGVLFNLHYRNCFLDKYLSGSCHSEILQGGIIEQEEELKIRPLISSLMCGEISSDLINGFKINKIIKYWEKLNFIKNIDNKNNYYLTANGSWMVNNMISEIKQFLQ